MCWRPWGSSSRPRRRSADAASCLEEHLLPVCACGSVKARRSMAACTRTVSFWQQCSPLAACLHPYISTAAEMRTFGRVAAESRSCCAALARSPIRRDCRAGFHGRTGRRLQRAVAAGVLPHAAAQGRPGRQAVAAGHRGRHGGPGERALRVPGARACARRGARRGARQFEAAVRVMRAGVRRAGAQRAPGRPGSRRALRLRGAC